MSVYTLISADDLQLVLDLRDAGRLQSFEGIPRGIENSNYYVETDRGRYVLTLIERQDPACLSFSLRLMEAAAAAGLPVPAPVRTRQGWAWDCCLVNPTVLVSYRPGEHVETATPAQLHDLGATLAALHALDPAALAPDPGDAHGAAWRERVIARLRPELDAADTALLDRALAVVAELDLERFEKVPIHADVFRDNTLFEGDAVSGLVDLYYAHMGPRAYELAVAANDFCRAEAGGFDPEREAQLLAGYGEALPAAERAVWPQLTVLAALRFWLSRLADAAAPRPGEMPLTKDPDEFRQVLSDRLDAL